MRAVEPIPDTMQAAVLHAYDGAPDPLRVETRPVPRPQRGQVLVKMTAAPINPSDLMFLKGLYGVRKPLPVVPGWEGAGRVVATGDDWLSRLLLGKRVACGAPNQHDGTWAEYMLTPSSRCIPLIDAIDDEAGAMLIVNPLTAWGADGHRTQGRTSRLRADRRRQRTRTHAAAPEPALRRGGRPHRAPRGAGGTPALAGRTPCAEQRGAGLRRAAARNLPSVERDDCLSKPCRG
jgi:NADPH:quinone reductase and related Zn-dependent oxidoreductases